MSARLRAPLIALAALAALAVVVAGCGADTAGMAGPDAIAKVCNPGNTAPTYSELYTKYFAVNTPGHCATAECHSDPKHNSWICGPNKDTCYNGMVSIGLIDLANPGASRIGDPKASPLNWVNPNGPMPQDSPKPFPEGRDAIIAWVGACAQNN